MATPSERSQGVIKEYLTDLLMEHVLSPRCGRDVAAAIVDVMIAQRASGKWVPSFFMSIEQGDWMSASTFPTDAARGLFSDFATAAWTWHEEPFKRFAWCFTSDESVPWEDKIDGRTNSVADVSARMALGKATLARLEWKRAELAKAFGGDSTMPGTILVDYITEHVKRLLSADEDLLANSSLKKPRSRNRYRAPAPAGFIYFKDAVTKFGVKRTTGHGYCAELTDGETWRDPESGERLVNEAAFRAILQRKGIIPADGPPPSARKPKGRAR